MGVRVNQNVMAMNSHRQLTVSEGQLGRSLERLSSGYRINRAADDAAGLVISESLRSQVMGLRMATRNAQDGVSVVQTAEGALTETHAILQRMRELAIRSASTGSADLPSRDAAQVEVEQLKAELDRIATTTKFGDTNLLTGQSFRHETTELVSSGSTIDTTVNKTFGLLPDVEPGLIWTQDVTLTSNRVFDANLGPAEAKALEADINQAIDTMMAAHYSPAHEGRVVAEVRILGAPPTASFGTTFRVEEPHQWTIAIRQDNNGAGTANDVAADLFGIAAAGFEFSAKTGEDFSFHVGAGATADDRIAVELVDVRTTALDIDDLDVGDISSTNATLALLDSAITTVSTFRGNLGAYQNRFERTINNLSVTTENLASSESRIRDTDMATEMADFTRAQVLQQAGTAMLAQANTVPQGVLKLLQ